ncbi:prostaglandin D2 synthase-like protein [Daphnia pulex]|uniref:glutathione transferase n=1 Tax=Daphnia pulex TaxID=6669 RepID=E9GD76_DAPPU|nr:prostaglandin D2 synthase-like protein [Daphnia pulex]QNM80602.1 glutathione S-transferase sigma2 isoform b [Daphnia pulex]|eukprot:EFX82688.1 prostaglandin D2 synthase-like protein [Daphnia pulex]
MRSRTLDSVSPRKDYTLLQMKIPNYKLIYSNARGRADLARLILHCAGVPFEDIHCGHSDWPSIKQDTSFRQVPILEVDGVHLESHQSNAVARYLARQHGLAGQNQWEETRADMIVDCMCYLHAGMCPITREKNMEKQQELFDEINQEMIQPHAEVIEQLLINNGSGYLVGNALTWADLAYYAYFTTPIMELFGGQVLEDHPHLRQLVKHIGDIPTIKKYIEKSVRKN